MAAAVKMMSAPVVAVVVVPQQKPCGLNCHNHRMPMRLVRREQVAQAVRVAPQVPQALLEAPHISAQ